MRVALLAAAAALAASARPVRPPAAPPAAPLVLADVARDGRRGARGGAWYQTNDRVMGGVSTSTLGVDGALGRPAVRLRARVRLENRGGFALLGLPVETAAGPLDARGYRAVRLVVRGNGERYTLSLRTPDTRSPVQFYDAEFAAPAAWTTVELPLAAFRAVEVEAPLDRARLRQLWLVAKGRAFDADLAVAGVALVP